MLDKINHIKQRFTEDDYDEFRSKSLALRAETQEDLE